MFSEIKPAPFETSFSVKIKISNKGKEVAIKINDD